MALDRTIQEFDVRTFIAGSAGNTAGVIIIECQALLIDLLTKFSTNTPDDFNLNVHLVDAAIAQQIADHIEKDLGPDRQREIQQGPRACSTIVPLMTCW
mmetsp:Transcript_68713/g.129669  ORF Transcript_68713/g.129669 Transcript_68713/m.129669 type:complete len:99 (+) Transcript_68713:1164-1460(+)